MIRLANEHDVNPSGIPGKENDKIRFTQRRISI